MISGLTPFRKKCGARHFFRFVPSCGIVDFARDFHARARSSAFSLTYLSRTSDLRPISRIFGLGLATRIYLAVGATNLRRGFKGLYGLIRDRLSCDSASAHLFLTDCRKRHLIH
jgi:IS66 Orf2 like protein